MKSLQEIYQQYIMPGQEGGDKGTDHSYIEVYEELFKDMRFTAKNVLEIGVQYGASLRMWRDYFEKAKIFGIDIDPNCQKYEEINPAGVAPWPEYKIQVDILNSTDSKAVNIYRINNQDGTYPVDLEFDVIIDDGSHKTIHQVWTFNLFFPMLKPGGIYIIEDCLNLERDAVIYNMLHDNVQILDRRHVKQRGDDVLIVIRK